MIWWGVIPKWKSRHKPFGKASWSPRSERCFDWSRIRRIRHQKLHYGLQLEQSVNTYFLIVTAWIHISRDEKWHTDTRKNLTLFEHCYVPYSMSGSYVLILKILNWSVNWPMQINDYMYVKDAKMISYSECTLSKVLVSWKLENVSPLPITFLPNPESWSHETYNISGRLHISKVWSTLWIHLPNHFLPKLILLPIPYHVL